MQESGLTSAVPTDRCLLVAVSQWPPYVMGNFPDYTGASIDIFKVIQKKLGFCYEFMRPPDGLWGAPLRNGSWFGMMGMMQRKEADMAIGPFGVTLSRSSVADFSVPILSTDHTIFYPRPLVEPDLLGFTKAFTLTVWAAVLASLVVVTAAALICHFISPPRGKREPVEGAEDVSALTSHPAPHDRLSWLWGYMVLLGQVLLKRKSGAGERVVVAVWLLASLILAVVYKSNLKALLIVPKVRIPFDSLEELVTQDEMKWNFPKGSIVQSFFEAAYAENATSTMGLGWAGHYNLLLLPRSSIPSALSGVAGLLTRHSSIYMMAQDFSQRGLCRLAITRGGFMAVQYSMAFPLNSSLRPVVDQLIYHMGEFGLLDKYLRADISNTTHCLQPPGREDYRSDRKLAIGDFLGVFSLYAAGVVGSVVVFLVEVVSDHWWRCARKVSWLQPSTGLGSGGRRSRTRHLHLVGAINGGGPDWLRRSLWVKFFTIVTATSILVGPTVRIDVSRPVTKSVLLSRSSNQEFLKVILFIIDFPFVVAPRGYTSRYCSANIVRVFQEFLADFAYSEVFETAAALFQSYLISSLRHLVMAAQPQVDDGAHDFYQHNATVCYNCTFLELARTQGPRLLGHQNTGASSSRPSEHKGLVFSAIRTQGPRFLGHQNTRASSSRPSEHRGLVFSATEHRGLVFSAIRTQGPLFRPLEHWYLLFLAILGRRPHLPGHQRTMTTLYGQRSKRTSSPLVVRSQGPPLCGQQNT
ncbi:glutamate receptor ionotropic, delta-1-like [Homarus americanus]|uniref:glutamate receptor ionotropic, delta-1-like n=1 Tax=Homarus americanus TaxID=6706 RepID=UPI001C4873CC|nr:glutamate receptor ionotropic, delta-1-like [Homarus americanus]